MEFKQLVSWKKIFFITLFLAIALLADQVRVAAIWGVEGQFFTLFQLLGPLPAVFLGLTGGLIAVLGAEVINFVALNKELTLINVMRLAPMLFGAAYFALHDSKNKWFTALIPLACMLLFWLNPIGQQASVYALYWLIPSICVAFFSQNLFAKALGATFTAHAVGSTLWLYSVSMPASTWIALIPVVAMERFSFAIGITLSYVALNAVLSIVDAFVPRLELTKFVSINPLPWFK